MASLSIEFLEAGLMYPEVVQEGDCCHIHLYGEELGCKQCNSFFRARDWDQLEDVAETLVAPDTGRWLR